MVRLALLVLLAASSVAWGADADLYTVAVPVLDRSEEQRAEGNARALDAVTVRITGMRDIASDESLAPLRVQAGRYVLARTYRATEDGLLLEARFDGQALEAAIAQQGLPVWSGSRPRTLVWLVLDKPRRHLLADDEAGLAREELFGAAETRGVPLILPLMDAADVTAISVTDVAGGFEEPVRHASVRYGPDVILTGRARLGPGGTAFVNWMLYAGDVRRDWTGSLADGPHGLADFLAGRLAGTVQADVRDAFIEVHGLHSLSAYAEIERKLKRLPIVGKVDVDGVSGDTVVFRIALRGDLRQLERAIGLDDSLVPESRSTAQPEHPEQAETLHYRYEP